MPLFFPVFFAGASVEGVEAFTIVVLGRRRFGFAVAPAFEDFSTVFGLVVRKAPRTFSSCSWPRKIMLPKPERLIATRKMPEKTATIFILKLLLPNKCVRDY